MMPKKNDNVLRVNAVKRIYKGKEKIQKLVTIPLTRTDIQPGDFIKFKKVEII
jgi:hypothetical protein